MKLSVKVSIEVLLQFATKEQHILFKAEFISNFFLGPEMLTDRQTDEQTDRRADRQTEKRTNILTDGQLYIWNLF